MQYHVIAIYKGTLYKRMSRAASILYTESRGKNPAYITTPRSPNHRSPKLPTQPKHGNTTVHPRMYRRWYLNVLFSYTNRLVAGVPPQDPPYIP